MQFILANSSWLWLLAFGAVPVLVHLFARSNPQKYHFSNTEFLQRIIKKTARLKKPQDWLILLLRTLAVLTLLFAFLQPLLTSKGEIEVGRKTTIFVIDRSASMAAKDGNTDRFSLACQKAGELLKSATSDNANIIWMDALPNGIFPQPGPNLDYLRDLLTRSEVSHEAGSAASAIQTAVSQLELVKGRRELVIISDFQSSAWQDFKIETPKGIDLVKVQIGGSELENLSLQSIFTSPTEPVIGQDVTVITLVRNYSSTPRRTTLYLESGGSRQSHEVNIPAWGEAESNFQTRFSDAGLVPMTARIAGDNFPGDDARHTIVQVRDALQFVSLAPEDSSEAATFSRLASSLDWLEHRTSSKLPVPGSCDFLFVHQWTGQEIDSLKNLAATGTTIFTKPALGLTYNALNQLFDLNLAPPSTRIAPARNDGDGWRARISTKADPDTPAFTLFASGEFGSPAAGLFKARFTLPQTPDLTHYLDYQDGIPALVATSATGSASPRFLWNLPLTSPETTWPAQSAFVPFLAELLLNSRSNPSANSLELLPGSQIAWLPGSGISPESLTLEATPGTPLETEVIMTGEGPHILSKTPATPGIYNWKMSNAIVHQQAVNFPPTESDLRLTNPDFISGGEVIDPSKLLRRAALGDGLPLWHWLVAAALAFLLTESLVSLWRPKPTAA
ncbi:BatA and WFA domain-containing protein [Verrucomicrobiaceae bacterium 227]